MSGSCPRPTAARLTAVGRGAIAVVRICHVPERWWSEGLPHFRPAARHSIALGHIGRIVFGRWGDDLPEDVVVCRTQTDVCEIQCHGGEFAIARILNDLAHAGAEIVDAFEQTAAGSDPLTAELELCLSQALTFRTADLINEQAQGCLRRSIDELRGDLSVNPWTARRVRLEELLRWADFGRHLTQPWSVVLMGRPNVGKSSLINALLGFQRSIVSPTPGTTRDTVQEITAFDGWPVELTDTAGLRRTDDELEAAGIARARSSLERADLRVLVLNIAESPTPNDDERLRTSAQNLVVANQCDLPDQWGSALPPGAIRTSSVTLEGLAELQRALAARLVPQVPPPGTAVPLTTRQIDCLRVAHEAAVAQSAEQYEAALHAFCFGTTPEPRT